MAKPKQRERARQLRSTGMSIGAIAAKLHEPKSTVSYWCKNIRLTEQQIVTIQKKHKVESVAALLRAAEKQRTQRLQREQKMEACGQKDVGSVSRRDLFFLGLGLYWGEGYKYEHAELGFTNSDPVMIVSYIAWLRTCFGIQPADLICRVSINSVHKQRMADVERYWRRVTSVPACQFSQTSLIRAHSKKVYTNTAEHFGTLRVKVRKGKDVRCRIQSAIAEVGRQMQER